MSISSLRSLANELPGIAVDLVREYRLYFPRWFGMAMPQFCLACYLVSRWGRGLEPLGLGMMLDGIMLLLVSIAGMAIGPITVFLDIREDEPILLGPRDHRVDLVWWYVSLPTYALAVLGYLFGNGDRWLLGYLLAFVFIRGLGIVLVFLWEHRDDI